MSRRSRLPERSGSRMDASCPRPTRACLGGLWMKRAVYLFICILTSLGYAGLAHALSPGERVDNFRLLDQSGASHELYYHSDAKAIVLMAHGNGCDIVRNTLPALKELREKYRAQGVEFLLIDSNLQDSR